MGSPTKATDRDLMGNRVGIIYGQGVISYAGCWCGLVRAREGLHKDPVLLTCGSEDHADFRSYGVEEALTTKRPLISRTSVF